MQKLFRASSPGFPSTTSRWPPDPLLYTRRFPKETQGAKREGAWKTGLRAHGAALPTVGEKAKCSPPQTAQTALGLVRRRGAKHREKCWKRELSKETYSRPTPNSAIATSDSISGDLHTIV